MFFQQYKAEFLLKKKGGYIITQSDSTEFIFNFIIDLYLFTSSWISPLPYHHLDGNQQSILCFWLYFYFVCLPIFQNPRVSEIIWYLCLYDLFHLA